MKYCKQLFSLSLAAAMSAVPITASSNYVPTTDSSKQFKAFAVGPGLENLSVSDSYASYQWGLKNDGEFKLTTLKDKFYQLKLMDRFLKDEPDYAGLPIDIGPDSIEATTYKAVAGVDINIRPAWELYDSSANPKRDVVVAVIDTGIDFSHPDLIHSQWINPGEIPDDGIDNDGNGFIDDVNGWNFYGNNNIVFAGSEDNHGTHAAGTIAAGRSDSGIAGIADNHHVKIMSVKALGGSDGSGVTANITQAIQYAEANGASICNLSFGTTAYSEEVAQAIQSSHMLFIIAAGNGNSSGIGYSLDESPVYPAALPYDNIIAVANLLFDGSLIYSSNYGVTSVDIAAPGCYILSTAPGNDYAFHTGTSMAAPMVTGVAALLYSYRPELTLTDVRNIIFASARKDEHLTGLLSTGGMLDAYSALSWQ